MDILHLFCEIDDFCQLFEPYWRKHLFETGQKRRNRSSTLHLSEVMTIIILFHLSGYRDFKHFYTLHVQEQLRRDFPALVSYNRFVELMPSSMVPLCCYLRSRFGEASGICFIDSTSIAVCHNRRIHSHKVFRDSARRGKTSVDWFYGFKLHLIINDCGELLSIRLTSGNTDDRVPVQKMSTGLVGKLFGDKGYVSQALFEQLFSRHLQLITRLRAKMRNRLMPIFDKLMLRKRSIIECVNDQLKNISQIEHTRHRSPKNFFVNLIAGLIAYTFREKKPSLGIRINALLALPEATS